MTHSYTHYTFKKGDPKACCMRCGSIWNISRIRKQWNGLRVCPECFEHRNAQDFVKGVRDPQQIRGGAVPPAADIFVEPTAQKASDL